MDIGKNKPVIQQRATHFQKVIFVMSSLIINNFLQNEKIIGYSPLYSQCFCCLTSQAHHSHWPEHEVLTPGVHLFVYKPQCHQGLASVHTCPLTGTDRFHANHSHAGQRWLCDDPCACMSASGTAHSFWHHPEDCSVHLVHKNLNGTASGGCWGHKRSVECIPHQPRRSGCCGNCNHCECSHTGTRGHRCRHPGSILDHTGRSPHKPACMALNRMGPDRWRGRLCHRTYSGYSVGRTWLRGEMQRRRMINNMEEDHKCLNRSSFWAL